MKTLDIVAGARPNFMKVAPIIRAIEKRRAEPSALAFRLVHTGQHYDAKMSANFFTQLGIPEPNVNLAVGSGTQAEQAAAVMIGYEKLLRDARTDLCLVVGDVTSTMACAIAARKLGVRVAHVEAGIRSGDWSMPEEINRVVTDSISNFFFTTTEMASQNLRKAGVADSQIFFVGNTMIDTLLFNMPRLQPPAFWTEVGLNAGEYFVVTLHRPSNVDDADAFAGLLRAIALATRGLPVVFPVHPRTARMLQGVSGTPRNFLWVEPQPYLEFNFLVKHAKAVITDSGGITEEATMLGVPCLTLRETTERPETITIGTNELVGTNPIALHSALDRLFAGRWKKGGIPEKWDGRTGERIVSVIESLLNKE